MEMRNPLLPKERKEYRLAEKLRRLRALRRLTQKEVAQATAVAQKEANDAQVASQLEIAQKQTDLAKRQAALSPSTSEIWRRRWRSCRRP